DNFPTVTAGIDLDSDVVFALATHPNIVSTRLSCGNIGKTQRVSAEFGYQSIFATFAGKSDVFLADASLKRSRSRRGFG
ncbi:hypothetical protein GYMLUDRAFT_42077, partial [Collybiopsis luxurians FD-317 M1]